MNLRLGVSASVAKRHPQFRDHGTGVRSHTGPYLERPGRLLHQHPQAVREPGGAAPTQIGHDRRVQGPIHPLIANGLRVTRGCRQHRCLAHESR